MKVKIKRLYDSAKLPQYPNEQAGAMDLFACINRPEKVYPGQVQLIGTGVVIEVPFGYGLVVTSRTGLYLKHKVSVVSTVVDNGNCHTELKVLVLNEGEDPFYVNPEAKIAQCHIVPLPDIEWVEA